MTGARAEVLRQYRAHVNRGFATVASLLGAPVESRSHGAVVQAEDGSEYLDCGGYGVFFLGHCHPRVVAEVGEQLRRHPLATKGMLEPRLAQAASLIAAIAPNGLESVVLTNSGAEATELALKLARANGFRTVIAMANGFHGKTLGALSVTGRARYQRPAHPLLPQVEFVPYGDPQPLAAALGRVDRACVLLEPVQGEGGVIIPPPGYLAEVSRLCRRSGSLLIVDEVQTGLGRLGTWWGCDAESITPDIMLIGKALSGGVIPVGAVLATAEVFEVLNRDPLLHTSTFGGNPLAAAAAVAAICTIQQEGLLQRSRELGDRLGRGLAAIVAEHGGDAVRQVRGRGLLIGVQLADEATAASLTAELLTRRILTSYSLNSSSVVRLTPPAVMTPAQADQVLAAFAGALRSVDHQSAGHAVAR